MRYDYYVSPKACTSEVEVLTEDIIDRDAIKSNVAMLTLAANALGLRVGVHTCTVHVKALYDYMQIPCPRHLDLKKYPIHAQSYVLKWYRLGIAFIGTWTCWYVVLGWKCIHSFLRTDSRDPRLATQASPQLHQKSSC